MQEYELTVLFSGNQTTEEAEKLAENVKEVLITAKAEIKHYHSLGRQKLAYKIMGQIYGEYRVWLFESEPEAIKTLNEKFRISQYIMRHLIIKLENVSIKEKIENLESPRKEGEQEKQSEEEAIQVEELIEQNKEKTPEHKEIEKETEKASLEQLDEKLDELLKDDKI